MAHARPSASRVRRLLAQETTSIITQLGGEPTAQDEAQETITKTTTLSLLYESNFVPKVEEGEPPASSFPPQGGKALMIRTKEEPHLYLVIKGEDLGLVTKPTLGVGAFWHCANRNRLWYLFRNTVTGTYLSCDREGNLCIREFIRGVTEYFINEEHENSGYFLNANHIRGLFPLGISEDEDGMRLVVLEGRATAWKIIQAKNFTSLVTLTCLY
ncbi:hypothetical protein ACHAQJ_000206 [Trichoderma viride]